MTMLRGGGQITSRKAILVGDAQLACTASDSKIRVYSSLGSGELLFEMEGHTDEVTDLCLRPQSSANDVAGASRVFSCGKDGRLKEWDTSNGTCVASWDLPDRRPAESIVVLGHTAYVSFFWRGEDAGRVVAYDLAKGQANEVRIKLSTPRPVVSSGPRSRIVATCDRHTVLVWNVEREGFGKRRALRMHHTKAISCVAVSPDGLRVAAGDVTGRILIWHDLNRAFEAMASTEAASKGKDAWNSGELQDDEGFVEHEEPPAASVHWHAHAVGCLSFSTDGRYLLSGGEEAVLVLWDVQTSGRAYLPRLGGPLTGMSPCPDDPARYCLRQSDNTLRVVNIASMMIECSIHGIRPVPRGVQVAPVTFEGRLGHAVVVGDHSMLQFFDVSRDLHVDRLQLSRRNIVSMSGEEDESASVQAICFDKSADILVSVEHSSDNYLLKFWDRSPDAQRQYGTPYRLNTLAENPHRTASGNHAITGLALCRSVSSSSAMDYSLSSSSPAAASRSAASATLVATCSTSGDFALWEMYRGGAQQRDRATFTWRKMASIPGHHGDPLTAVAFSSDGSLLAVAGDQGALSLWDTASCAFVGELPSAFASSDSNKPSFPLDGPGDGQEDQPLRAMTRIFFLPGSPIMVYVCASGMVVYDIMSLNVVWSAELDHICSAAADPASSHWALVVGSADPIVLVFEGQSNRPKMGWTIRQRQTSVPKPVTLNPATVGGAKELERRAKASRSVAVPELAFVPRHTATYNAARTLSVPGCSPLVVFSTDREFMSVIGETNVDMGPQIRTGDSALGSGQGGQGGQGSQVDSAGQPTITPLGYAGIFGSSARVPMDGVAIHGPSEAFDGAPGDRPRFAETLPAVEALALDFLSSLLD